MPRYTKVIYTVDLSLVNSLWLEKTYAGRALRWRVFLLLLWCVVSCLPASCLGITRMSTDSKEPVVEVSQFQRLQRFLQSSTFDAHLGTSEGKTPTKSVETWAVVSLDCWGISEQKICNQRRQVSAKKGVNKILTVSSLCTSGNLCRLPPQTGWTQSTSPAVILRIISAVLFANVMFLAVQLQFEGSRVGENSDLASHSIFMWVFPKKDGTPKSSILLGFSIINHPFWGTPICGNTHVSQQPAKQALAFKLFQAFDSKVSWIL